MQRTTWRCCGVWRWVSSRRSPRSRLVSRASADARAGIWLIWARSWDGGFKCDRPVCVMVCSYNDSWLRLFSLRQRPFYDRNTSLGKHPFAGRMSAEISCGVPGLRRAQPERIFVFHRAGSVSAAQRPLTRVLIKTQKPRNPETQKPRSQNPKPRTQKPQATSHRPKALSVRPPPQHAGAQCDWRPAPVTATPRRCAGPAQAVHCATRVGWPTGAAGWPRR